MNYIKGGMIALGIGVAAICSCTFLDDGEGYIGISILSLGILCIILGLSLIMASLFRKYFLKGKVIKANPWMVISVIILVVLVFRLIRNMLQI